MSPDDLSKRGPLLASAAASAVSFRPGTVAATEPDLSFAAPDRKVSGLGGYRAIGVGGGGAMSGLAFSPHQNLWFVGTDMGTLFRSWSGGESWEAVHNFQAAFDSTLNTTTPVGFGTQADIVFHAVRAGLCLRSTTCGATFDRIAFDFMGRRIIYWHPVLNQSGIILAGAEDGLFRSTDEGLTWSTVHGISGRAVGTAVDCRAAQPIIYHGTAEGVFKSTDSGATFALMWSHPLVSFAGGFDSNRATLAALSDELFGDGATRRALWITNNDGIFVRNAQKAGDFVRLAENNARRIYVTGSAMWPNQMGTTVLVSDDYGATFQTRFLQLDWTKNPFAPWPATQLEYSAVGLDIGWDDDGYNSFHVSPVDANLAGGAQAYFVHITQDGGQTWKAPFTRYAEPPVLGQPERKMKGQRWRSRGLEVTSIRYLRFHPSNPSFGIACGCDHQTLVTENGGETWTIKHAGYVTTYDIAFDPHDQNRFFGAVGNLHDWGHSGTYEPDVRPDMGGVRWYDRSSGAWSALPIAGFTLDVRCLAVVYDEKTDELYVGTQGLGVARGKANGQGWAWVNDGLAGPMLVVPQLAIDPISQDVYAVLSASSLDFENASATGLYRLNKASGQWELLRNSVETPPGGEPYKSKLLAYPTSFAIDFCGIPGERALFLTDIEVGGQWRSTGVWRAYENDLTWRLVQQSAGAYHVLLDARTNANTRTLRVYLSSNVNSIDALLGQANNYGALYSDAGGDPNTWKRNDAFPIQAHLWSATPSPFDDNEIFYTCFAAGMYRGPRPL